MLWIRTLIGVALGGRGCTQVPDFPGRDRREGRPMSSKRVILIDANADRRALWCGHLQQIPFCRLMRDIGDMARAPGLVREARPDFVIVGHELPDSGGIHLARRLIQDSPGLAVLVLADEARCEDVLQALRAGVRDFLVRPTPHELRATLSRLAHLPAFAEPTGGGRTIALFTPKGGTGQTSLAANVAIALQQESGKSVALVDLNGRSGQLDLHLDLYPPCSWLEAIGKGLPWERACHPHRSGTTLVVASRSADAVAPEAVQHLLPALARRHDFIVADVDHRPHAGAVAALRAAAAILVPVRLDLGGLRAAQLALQIAQEHHIPPDRLRLLTIGGGTPGGLSPQAVSDILKHDVAWRLPDEPALTTAAIDRGIPVVVGDPHSLLAQSVRRLARDLAGLANDEAPAGSGGLQSLRDWWRRFTSRSVGRTDARPSRVLR
jgi:pilus assembly protein CpaE